METYQRQLEEAAGRAVHALAAAGDERAQLSAFANADFAGMIDAAVDEGLKTPGAEDLTARFRAILQVELERIETLPIADAVRAKLRLAWQHKLRRAEAQEQRWALISALKEA